MIGYLLNEKEVELFSIFAPEINNSDFTVGMLHSKLHNQKNQEARRAVKVCIDLIKLRTLCDEFSPDMHECEELTRSIAGNLSKITGVDFKPGSKHSPHYGISHKLKLYDLNMTVNLYITKNYETLKQKISAIEFNV